MPDRHFEEDLVVDASYHQVFLAPMDTSPVYDEAAAGTLVCVVDDQTSLIVTTGCMDGPVRLTIRLHSARPSEQDAWEVREEASIRISEPLLTWSPIGVPLGAENFNRPVLTPLASGPHRVRVSGRGRGTRKDEYVSSTEAPTEHYLIEVWPEATLRERVTAFDDGNGVSSSTNS